MTRLTILENRDGINALELNHRFQQLSKGLSNLNSGQDQQPAPTISSFTNAPHDHADGAGGGQLNLAAIDSESATAGLVATSDGAGNVTWSDISSSFLGLSDTLASFSGHGSKLLRVNSAGDAIEAVAIPDKDSTIVDEATDYTTTSTSFTDVDATDLSKTLTTQGGPVVVMFLGSIKHSTTGMRIYLEIDVDGSPHATEDGILLWSTTTASELHPMAFARIITGLSAGSHTFKLQWKVSSGTATMYAGAGTSTLDVHPQFIVMEVSS